ncbi:MAG TPA: MerR family transcriptional regulator, partial [Jatrophihabitantaceae bacterium]|nr:MerR family transcriptional regulator [Jatrophihabitantaceae bacterium]
VTVRTLHHYDEIGLLSPSARSAAGYRLYDDAELLRLRQIVFYCELDFPLPPAMHRGLGEMYVTDERFTVHYETIEPGLARYVRDAFVAEADSAGAG